jgi:transcriptional regulator with XRE-family HTH domain
MDKRKADTLRFSGSFIAELRLSRGLSREGLSMATGLHVNTIANIERGRVDPSFLAVSLAFLHLDCPYVLVRKEGLIPVAGSMRTPAAGLRASPSDIVLKTGRRFRERRTALGLTLEEVARLSGIHRNTLWNLEHGLTVSSISNTHRILSALDVGIVTGDGGDILLG